MREGLMMHGSSGTPYLEVVEVIFHIVSLILTTIWLKKK